MGKNKKLREWIAKYLTESGYGLVLYGIHLNLQRKSTRDRVRIICHYVDSNRLPHDCICMHSATIYSSQSDSLNVESASGFMKSLKLAQQKHERVQNLFAINGV